MEDTASPNSVNSRLRNSIGSVKHFILQKRKSSNITFKTLKLGRASAEVKPEVCCKNGFPLRTQHATKYLFRGYQILGVNMPQKYRALYVIYALILNGLVTLYLPISFGLSYFTMSADELKIGPLLTSIQVAINVWACSIKLVVMMFMLPKLRSAELVMDRLDRRLSGKEELEELRKVIHQGNRFVVLFAIAYWSYSTSTFLGSIAMGRPPYSLYIPYMDWRNSRWEFVVAAITEFLLMDVACFQQVVDDSYPVIYVCILITHMKILFMRIAKLGCDPSVSLDQNFEELKLSIKDHKNLLSLFNIIAPVISVTIFIQFMITASLLGTTLINIFLFSADLSSSVASCFYILAVVVEIFPLCYYAQCLMEQSNRMSMIIFHSNWIEQDVRFRKMLVFFMQRSQRIMDLTAGKLVPITLNSFLSIAKFSFTLYTFIKEMGIKDKYGLK